MKTLTTISMEQRPAFTRRLSNLIIKIMKQYDISCAALARQCSVHPATFYPWYRGVKCPKNIVVYNQVTAYLKALDLTRKVNKQGSWLSEDIPALPKPAKALRNEEEVEEQLTLEFDEVIIGPAPLVDNSSLVSVETNNRIEEPEEPEEPEDALLVLPKKDVLALVSVGLNKLLLNGNYLVTGIEIKGESGRVLFKEK